MPLRSLLFWPHLIAGVLSATIILLMSVTGVLLTYERQMIAWADARTFDLAPPTPGASPLTADELLATAASGKAPQALTIHAGGSMPPSLGYGRGGGTVWVDPYTGAELGNGSEGMRGFMSSMRSWHRWLALEGESRAVGRAITGAFNLAFLFLILSGFYLWWPRRWSPRAFAAVLLLRVRARGKLRDWNWHHALGFWSAIPLAIIVASGVVISYEWAGNLLKRLAGDGGAAPARLDAPAAPADSTGEPMTLEALFTRAADQTPGWRTISLRLPAEEVAVFTIDAGTGGQPQHRGTLTLDRATGQTVSWEPFESLDRARRWRSIARFAHTGEVGGLIGQTIAGLVSAATAVLVWTGLALTFRRFFGKRRGPEGADDADGSSVAD